MGVFSIVPPLWLGIGGFLLGAIAGSFLATIITRWPREQSVIVDRSRCDDCGEVVSACYLVPILGYLVLRGRCRACGNPIDSVHWRVELIAAFIGVAAIMLYPDWWGLAGAIFGWALLALIVLDIRHFWLPDRITLPLIGAGLAIALFRGTPSITDSLIGAASGFLVLALINQAYRALRGHNGLGGGDAKLLAGIGAWLGWQMLPFVLLLASASGLLWALVRVMQGHSLAARDRLPLGAFMAAVAWLIWIAGSPVSAYFRG